MRKIFVFLASAILAGPAIASAPAPSGGTGAGTAADGKKVVCKKQANTGTRFPERRCLTKSQWEQMIEQQRREARELIDRPSQGPRGN